MTDRPLDAARPSTKRRSVVLVAGGDPVLRREVAKCLSESGAQTILLSVDPRLELDPGAAEHIEYEAGRVDSLSDLVRVAARHHVDRTIYLPESTDRWDRDRAPDACQGHLARLLNVFHLAELHDLQRVVYSSSGHVYGPPSYYRDLVGRSVVDERDPLSPTTLRGAADVMAEGLARQFSASYGVELVGLRCVLNFAPGILTASSSLLDTAIADAASNGSGTVGAPWEPSTHTNTMSLRDTAAMFAAASLHPRPFTLPVYNMGSGDYMTLAEMLEVANGILSPAKTLRYDPAARGQWGTRLDLPDIKSCAIRDELDWVPSYSFEQGIREAAINYTYQHFNQAGAIRHP